MIHPGAREPEALAAPSLSLLPMVPGAALPAGSHLTEAQGVKHHLIAHALPQAAEAAP